MCRSYFEGTGTEFHIDIIIKYDRDAFVDQRHNSVLAAKVRVARIFRVHTDGGIAHNCFRAYGCYGNIFITVFYFIAQVGQFRLRVFVQYLFIAQRGFGLRVPVDHLRTAIDISFLMQVYKYVDYRFVISIIHGEMSTVPVQCTAQLFQLLQDDAAIFFLPFPGIFQELFAG
ncbi:hypothetical protein D3C72_669680 [compost metagenome]